MTHKHIISLSAIILLSCFILYSQRTGKARLIYNTLEEVDASVDKLKLQKIREWGGENEEDEHKFFETPIGIKMCGENKVYICDQHNHVIKVFSEDGDYLQSIGRKGQGPADLYSPSSFAISRTGDIWIYEIGGRRVQCFSPDGKSKHIFKQMQTLKIIGVTKNDELVTFNKHDTIKSGKLVCILDNKGNILRRTGQYHDPIRHALYSEQLHFTMDNDDYIYALNTAAPVIRKYSPDGKLILAVTFELPYEIPYKISLNKEKNEIHRLDAKSFRTDGSIKIKKGHGGVIQKKKEMKKWVMHGIATDHQKRIFTLTQKRMKTEKEKMASLLIWSRNRLGRKLVKYDVLKKMHIYRIIVFSPGGKILAVKDLSVICDSLYIHKNKLFLIDGGYYQRIIEYKITFEG